ncbi:YfbK domain-containing protein, partial [Salmonella enterica subsp. enterica serovar Kentucky]|uniref:YfbK domain-containing protein n=1 Tax=Salmonella enterica TaxID=28901 RepID=UPI003F4C7BC8
LAECPVVMGKMPSFAEASDDFSFLSDVASFVQILRGSDSLSDTTCPHFFIWGELARGEYKQGYRGEFIKLVKLAVGLSH